MPRTLLALLVVALLGACGADHAAAPPPDLAQHIAQWRGVDPAALRSVTDGVWIDDAGGIYGACDDVYAAVTSSSVEWPPATTAPVIRCW